jgi:hypothetical protein
MILTVVTTWRLLWKDEEALKGPLKVQHDLWGKLWEKLLENNNFENL